MDGLMDGWMTESIPFHQWKSAWRVEEDEGTVVTEND